MRLQGKVAIVTGSTRGIGRAIAVRFGTEGAKVIVTGRTADAGQAVASAIVESGGSAMFVSADLGIEDDVRRLTAEAARRFGRIDILVNSAAPTDVITEQDAAVDAISTEVWQQIFHGTATTTLWTCKHVFPHMIAAGGGAILNLSTLSAVRAGAGKAGYGPAKAAVEALTRSIAVDGAKHRIRANSMGLGFILSGPGHEAMAADPRIGAAIRANHLTRLGTLDDVCHAAVFLASDESEFITGAGVAVDGGASCRMPATEFK